MTTILKPIGQISELTGQAYVTRDGGAPEPLELGAKIYQGDIVETQAGSALNITFTDDSHFAVSEQTNLTIDEYVFDPATEGGVQDFSVLKGMFVYTSGLIGRDDPDDVNIDTPVGSIGIRGTIIAGNVDSGEITVVEGAIVLRDLTGNELTLANQFETARFKPLGKGIEKVGQLEARDVSAKFDGVSDVAPSLFASIDDAAAENQPKAEPKPQAEQSEAPVDQGQEPQETQEDVQGDEAVQDKTPGQDPSEAAPDDGDGQDVSDPVQADDPAGEGLDSALGQPEANNQGNQGNQGVDQSPVQGRDGQASGPKGSESKKASQKASSETQNLEEAMDDLNVKGSDRLSNFLESIDLSDTGVSLVKSVVSSLKQGKFFKGRAARRLEEQAELDHDHSNDDLPFTFTAGTEDTPISETETTASPAFDNGITAVSRSYFDGFGFTHKFGTIETSASKIFTIDLARLFDVEDSDADIVYELHEDTITALEGLRGPGTKDIFDSIDDAGNVISFDDAIDGSILSLHINEADQYDIASGQLDIPIKVKAYHADAPDAYTTSFVQVTAYDVDAASSNVIHQTIHPGVDNLLGTADDFTSIVGVDKTVFVAEDATATVKVGATGSLKSINNTIFLGNGDTLDAEGYLVGKTVDIHAASHGNRIFGTDDQETVKIHNADNDIDTAGGDDTITLFWADAGGTLDGLNQHTVNAGAGDDVFIIKNAVSIDFGVLNDDLFIQNIETLQLVDTASVTLHARDVLHMTDDRNELILDHVTGTTAHNLHGLNRVDLDDDGVITAADTVEIDGDYYHEYEGHIDGQTVTLLVDTDINPV